MKKSIYAPTLKSVLKARQHSILHPERIVGNSYLGISSSLPVTQESCEMIGDFVIPRLESGESARNIIFPESD
jgi:hypothetical protein